MRHFVYYTDYPSIRTPDTNNIFQWSIIDCTPVSDVCSALINYDYSNLSGFDIQPAWILLHSSCTISSFTCSQTSAPSGVTIDLCATTDSSIATFSSVDGILSIKSNDPLQLEPGTYAPIISAVSSFGQSTSCSFDLILVNPCLDPALASIQITQPPSFEYTIGDEALQIPYPVFPSDFSITPSVCGALSAQIDSYD